MKCVVIGDIFIPSAVMASAVRESLGAEPLEYTWGPDNKEEMRTLIRAMETIGPDFRHLSDDLVQMIEDAEMVMTHLCPLPRSVLKEAENLEIIASNRGGTENIDLEYVKSHGIAVIHNPAHNANAVAEFTVGLILAETRNIARSHCALKQKSWREQYPRSGNILELSGCTIGIIGYGAIGSLTAEKLKGFSVNLLIHDPYLMGDHAGESGWVSLETLLKESDIVTLHARSSVPIIHRDALMLMKPSAYLINTARSDLVDTDALCEALDQKTIAGAAIDVFDQEPIPEDHPLLKFDAVTLTNHRGSDTRAAYCNSPAMLCGYIRDYLDKGTCRFLLGG